MSHADLVVLGRFTAMVPGRDFGDEYDRVHYAWATILLQRVLAGSANSGSVTLEVQLPHGQGADAVAAYAAQLPTSSVVLFLRNKGTEASRAGLDRAIVTRERPFFRLVIPHGILFTTGGRITTATGADEAYLLALAGREADEVIDMLDGIR